MKIKKAITVLMSCLFAGALLTGCGGTDTGANTGGQSPKIKLGMITHLNANESKMEEILQKAQETTEVNILKYGITYYENLHLMQMAIESNSVDQISLYNSVADYVIASNNKYEKIKDNSLNHLNDSFCFAVRKDDTQLKTDLDNAIKTMKDNGTLDSLVDKYITNVDKDNLPKVDIPMIEGADTIKIGITGDLPPLDLTLADNSPAGFNTALLAEIAKNLGKNIEIVQIDSGARAAALAAQKIDVIFWAVLPNGEKVPKDIDKPEEVEFTVPYFQDNVAHLKVSK
ncbi:MAG: transporter substrate-binding domain-containing protein [Selenomonadaceae bacterium]|nr:transporter substrate-binding domain-containing protein [Selenomonadaceae bacterium]